jgi:transposase
MGRIQVFYLFSPLFLGRNKLLTNDFRLWDRLYLAVEPVDMRKSFNGLWAEASNRLRENPFDGALFVFTNKQRNRIKILYWDGSGAWVFAKRLEKGRFSWPGGSDVCKLSILPRALGMLIEGIELKDKCKKVWFER